MAAYVGKNAYIAFGGTALQADYRTFEWSETIGVEDGSAGSDSWVRQIQTLTTGNASLTLRGISGTAGTAAWKALAPGQEGTLEYGPEGTSSTNRRLYVNAFVESRAEPLAYAGVTEWNFTFAFDGDITDTVY